MDELEYKTIIEWCCQNFYYKDMLSQSKQACNSYPTNEYFKILLCLAYVLSGKTHESIRETSSLIDFPEITLPVLLIQSFAVRSNTNVDRTTFGQIDTKIREERRKASPTSLSIAAMVLLLLRRFERAKEFSDRAYKLEPSDTRVSLAKGWVDLYSQPDDTEATTNHFESTLKQNPHHFNALLGSAKYKQYHGEYKSAISILNSLIVRCPRLCLPLIEKMTCQLAMKDWDQVKETANRISTIESNNLDSIKALSIVDLCRNGDRVSACRHVQLFFRNLILAEPKNIDSFVNNLQLFSRITGKDEDILLELSKVVDKMLQQNSTSGELMIEMGNINIQLGRIKEAENSYRNAIRVDESSFMALMGLARCQLFDASSDALELARQQIDFLMEIQSSSVSAELLFISAKVSVNEQNKILDCLNMAANVLLKNCKHLPYGYEYLKTLNPDLCLEIIKERLVHSNGTETNHQTTQEEPCLILLETLTDACPGFGTSLLMLSRAKMQNGHLQDALDTLKQFLDTIDSTNADAHLLKAQILIQQGRYQSASQSLEVGLSHDFKIRDNPIYHLITGIIQKENQDWERALSSYQEALSLIRYKPNHISDDIQISTREKATLYLELITAYSRTREFDKAFALIAEAKKQLVGTSEESKLIIGNAELYLNIGELDKAVQYLSEIMPGEPYYLQAHVKLADIYLNYRRDRQSFAKCFRELVEHCPGSKTYGMLGDAYMSIQEPERAIEAYERALRSNPTDKMAIASKMGRALVKTHQYAEAIDYYKEMIQQKDCKNLQLDLAKLFLKLRQYEKAESTLVNELQDNHETDIQSLQSRGEQLLLLAKVREKSNNIKGALLILKEAKDNQIRYIQRVEMAPNLIDQKQMVAEICLTMADYASSLRDYSQAIAYYKEALNHKPSDVKALLSLAKLYMQMNDLDRCAQSCSALLTADPDNEAASVMMADLAFRKVDFETAAFHFRQLLIRKPTYWTALARLIEVCRRTGNMDDLDEWLQRAEIATKVHSNPEAGYYYCAGLLDWRMGRLNSSLRHFNSARRDPEWGQQAIYNMIEICLDPDDETSLSSELFNDDGNDYQDSRTIALKTAYRLLEELNPKCSPHEKLTHRLLGNFFLLATRQKLNIEKALQDCTTLMNQESLRDHVGPALGLATAHILLKQTPRARNHLKRVCKNTWTFEDAEYLERCWLLLADISVQSNKYDLANDLLKRVLEHNATCVRAHELSGQIAEKDQNYREAATRYGEAWKFGGKTKLTVGYKLAYNYLKSKSYADAIEVCNQVLKQNPDYPRIRKDILEKAINHIRT